MLFAAFMARTTLLPNSFEAFMQYRFFLCSLSIQFVNAYEGRSNGSAGVRNLLITKYSEMSAVSGICLMITKTSVTLEGNISVSNIHSRITNRHLRGVSDTL